MNLPTVQLDSFETALLQELREEVAAREAARAALATPRPTGLVTAPSAPRSRGRLRWAMATLAAAVVAMAAWIAMPTPVTAPAYAVTTTPEGTVKVTIDRLEDAAGLQRALREHGISAVVDYLPGGMQCRDEGRYAQASSDHRGLLSTAIEGSHLTFSIPRNWLAPSETLVISLSTSPPVADGPAAFAMGFSVAEGAVGQCDPIPFPQVVVETDH
jgi:hypothetical protein